MTTARKRLAPAVQIKLKTVGVIGAVKNPFQEVEKDASGQSHHHLAAIHDNRLRRAELPIARLGLQANIERHRREIAEGHVENADESGPPSRAEPEEGLGRQAR